MPHTKRRNANRPTTNSGRLLSKAYRFLGDASFSGQQLLEVLKIREEIRKTLRIEG